MARLEKGENAKIDHINELVHDVKYGDKDKCNEGLTSLLSLFQPLIFKICNKWSEYFNDSSHILISWDEIICDAQYWFMMYTKSKYIINGEATYNKFIKDHLDQRIRYIYECKIKYVNKHMFPDPNKYGDTVGEDMFDEIIMKYGSHEGESNIDDLFNNTHQELKKELVRIIFLRIDNRRYFSQREADIFRKCMVEGKTHKEVGEGYGVSRTRISQVVGRIRNKLVDLLKEEQEWWEVYYD